MNDNLPLGATEQGRKSLYDSAYILAVEGLRVFPLYGIKPDWSCECGNPECGRNSGKHPQWKGFQFKATWNHEKIDKIWGHERPTANIGVLTGKHDGPGKFGADFPGLFVMDIDGLEGQASLQKWEAEHGELPLTWTVITGRPHSYQLYFRYPRNVERIPSRTNVLGPHVDVKADGGYVVGPGSQHFLGKVYKWKPGHGHWEIDLADPPQALIEALVLGKKTTPKPPKEPKKPKPRLDTDAVSPWLHNPKGQVPVLQTIKHHERNWILFLKACELRDALFGENKVLEMILALNTRWCEQPRDDEFTEEECAKLVKKAFTYARQARRRPGLYLGESPVKLHEWLTEHVKAFCKAFEGSQKEMAKALGVHRNTIPSAIKNLERRGLLTVEPITRQRSRYIPHPISEVREQKSRTVMHRIHTPTLLPFSPNPHSSDLRLLHMGGSPGQPHHMDGPLTSYRFQSHTDLPM